MQAADSSLSDGFNPPLEPRKFDWALAFWSLAAIVSCALWFGVLGQLAYYVPRSQKLFDEFKMKVPYSTEFVIQHAWWCVPLLIVATVGLCLAVRSRWCWLFLMLVLPLVIDVFVFVSMFIPTQELLKALGG